MPKQQVRECPFCGSLKRLTLHTQTYSGYFTHKIVRCQMCNFVFVGNTPPQSFYDNYYRDQSKYEGVRQHEAHDDATFKNVSNFLIKNLKKTASILDIGCSTGSLLAHIKSKGFKDVCGIDPAPQCKVVAKKKFGIQVGTYDIEGFTSKKKYDFIILSQVLEHVTDIKQSIFKIHSLLNDGGYLFIGVPDAGRFHHNFDEPFGEFSTEHINFFSEQTLFPFMNGFIKSKSISNDSALFTFWQKDASHDSDLSKYIQLSLKKQEKLQKLIDKLPKDLIVWGVGALTRRLLVMTDLPSKVKEYVDSSPNMTGTKIGGKTIKSPDLLREMKNPVLISSYKFQKEILKFMKKQGYKNKTYTV